jgi:hypothetical protein
LVLVVVPGCRKSPQRQINDQSSNNHRAVNVSSTSSKMKHFWSWPAFLRIVIANQQPFNVFDDLYAFPQV